MASEAEIAPTPPLEIDLAFSNGRVRICACLTADGLMRYWHSTIQPARADASRGREGSESAMTADRDQMALALSMTEAAVQDMAEAGLPPQQIAIALAWHMRKQAEIAMPTKEAAEVFIQGLIQ